MCPFLHWDIDSFGDWVSWVSCRFWILVPYQKSSCQRFSLILWAASWVWWLFLLLCQNNLTDLQQRSPKHMVEKRQPLQQMLLVKLNIICRRLKLDPWLSPCTKINSKWIKDLNIRPKTWKQLQDVVGNILEHISIGNDCLSRTQKIQHLRERMKKYCIKLSLIF
jgi:hypothetical protein